MRLDCSMCWLLQHSPVQVHFPVPFAYSLILQKHVNLGKPRQQWGLPCCFR